jgi:hypothetical protein
MNKTALLALALLLPMAEGRADTQVVFFARETKTDSTRIALSIENGEKVSGTKAWLPKDGHGARGHLDGIVNGDVIQVLWTFEIEGSEQSEEMVLKLDGGQLLIGEGELVEGGNGRMNLKEPNKVAFTTSLKKVPYTEPKAGSPERKAIMDSMRVPVTGYAGKAVQFTGTVRQVGNWASFTGSVAPADGKKPRNEDIAATMELDFAALLQKDAEGNWQTLHWGFAGDTSVMEEARENHPKAPWPLFEPVW